ncbi:hypothetical protein M8J76_011997 [Diaphorina citri]|nr:hypothetical protein M8J76_011997 [Diaphorina citri]
MSSDSEGDCCLPIKDLDSLLTWEESNISWSKLVVEKSHRADYVYDGTLEKSTRYSKSSIPRTLLCHDMKGGYLEDRFVQGANDVTDPYIFTHWTNVDVFVYFSHHFITIPPVGWINAAHVHGVQILGTLITEWKDGEQLWQKLYEDEKKLDKVIDKLVEICKHCQFDGYLINIENQVPPEHLEKVQYFVKKLTKQIHEQVDKSLIIWYDSVISPSGELKWQNELNESNKDFFKYSDGIFLNYNWTDETLQKSLQNAGVRKHDVYVGVDVFGRGCFGGGGFNCDLAMEKVRKFDLSAAIFGHGWTHETKQETESFHERELLFWSKLKPYLYTNVLVVDKTLNTTFNNGYGKFQYENGRKVENAVHYNLSKQSIQTNSTHEFEYEDGFNGTGCLKLKQSEQNKDHILLLTHVKVQKEFKLTIATKCSTTYDYSISVLYESEGPQEQKHKFILKKEEKTNDNELQDFSSTIIYEPEYSNASHKQHKKLIWFKDTWDVRVFNICPKYKGFVTQIRMTFASETLDLLLGELKIVTDV